MQIEIIEDIARVMAIELPWDELYMRDPAAHFYLSSRFIGAITLRAEGRFRILVAWDTADTDSEGKTGEPESWGHSSQEQRGGGRCIGILPLVVTTRWSKQAGRLYNVLDMLGHVFDADYTGILCDPAHADAVCSAFGTAVARMNMGRIILNYFSGPAARLTTFLNAAMTAFPAGTLVRHDNTHLINDGQTDNLVCPYIDLPDSFDAYLASLSANGRQKLRRLLRQLDSDSRLTITRTRPETYTEDVSILADLWYAQYCERKGHKRAQRLADLFKETVMIGLASGVVFLAILRRDGIPIAAQANYIDSVRRESLFHVGGRDERVQDISSGLMLQAYSIRWAIAQGLGRYDFTIGDEAYKYSLGATDRQIISAEIFTADGANISGKLDPLCRTETLKHLRSFIKRGHGDEAKTVATQALLAWPDLRSNSIGGADADHPSDADIDALIAGITSGALATRAVR